MPLQRKRPDASLWPQTLISSMGASRRASEWKNQPPRMSLLTQWMLMCCNIVFGQVGSQYDFSKLDMGQLRDRACKLEEQQQGIKKKVNQSHALDLLHMQHISTLFHIQFCGAHFIVVLLKEGLFMNADILFQMWFRDGTSIVEWTAQCSNLSLYNHSEHELRRAWWVEKQWLWVCHGGCGKVLHRKAHMGGICSIVCRLLRVQDCCCRLLALWKYNPFPHTLFPYIFWQILYKYLPLGPEWPRWRNVFYIYLFRAPEIQNTDTCICCGQSGGLHQCSYR